MFNYICNCKHIDFRDKNYQYWENNDSTTDENDIISYLEKNFMIEDKNILHIGIGNSNLAKKFINKNKIYGLTIAKSEINKAKLLKFINYYLFFCDKYSHNFNEVLKEFSFDYIIDPNLKSYSCCQKTFNFMFRNMTNLLNKNGVIITSKKGMSWYKKLKPKLTFNFKSFFHYKLKEIIGDTNNLLKIAECHELAKINYLELYFNKDICLFKKND